MNLCVNGLTQPCQMGLQVIENQLGKLGSHLVSEYANYVVKDGSVIIALANIIFFEIDFRFVKKLGDMTVKINEKIVSKLVDFSIVSPLKQDDTINSLTQATQLLTLFSIVTVKNVLLYRKLRPSLSPLASGVLTIATFAACLYYKASNYEAKKD